MARLVFEQLVQWTGWHRFVGLGAMARGGGALACLWKRPSEPNKSPGVWRKRRLMQTKVWAKGLHCVRTKVKAYPL